jgi:hypothetical protein
MDPFTITYICSVVSASYLMNILDYMKFQQNHNEIKNELEHLKNVIIKIKEQNVELNDSINKLKRI